MSVEFEAATILGRAYRGAPDPDDPGPPVEADGDGEALPYEVEFRREVARIVLEILNRNYVHQPHLCAKEAHQRGITTEQLIAAVIAHRVMKKVDEEYL